ncbi:serine/threonine-protein kinase/endoribonuclease IRE1-like [Daphnia carinata]|uniref:serine/threonine-protein kinase/endoribonuclease IRE1-like n=1 Tax=Daphnia carinata TaxID=120202 RepID=UPI00257C4B32|nr:serine/threonine-protein kinase/endoribonuclease IRE1-like [Daphnia carinata]
MSTVTVQCDKRDVLGKGPDGQVFKSTFAGKEVAVKRIQKDMGEDVEESKTRLAARIREVATLKKVDHLNVLKLIDVQEDPDFMYLILELCLGTLKDCIEGRLTDLMPPEIDGMMQMASGLQHIHSHKLVHRNIKPANVLISTSHVLKISDFVHCRPVTGFGSFSMSSGLEGTRIYAPPEFLSTEGKTKEQIKKIRVNVSVDVFSLGCLFFNYLTKGGHPFANGESPNEVSTPANICEGVKVLDGNRGLPKNHYAYAMIDGMTEKIPDQRWKLEKVLVTLKAEADRTATEENQ